MGAAFDNSAVSHNNETDIYGQRLYDSSSQFLFHRLYIRFLRYLMSTLIEMLLPWALYPKLSLPISNGGGWNKCSVFKKKKAILESYFNIKKTN